MGVNFSVSKYPTRINIGARMIQVADNIISDLVRHIPMILDLLPPNPTNSLRAVNAIRMTKININKLKKLDDERKQRRNQNHKSEL